jgi:hypothetical protein
MRQPFGVHRGHAERLEPGRVRGRHPIRVASSCLPIELARWDSIPGRGRVDRPGHLPCLRGRPAPAGLHRPSGSRRPRGALA